MADSGDTELLEMPSAIVSSFVSTNSLQPAELPNLIKSIFETLSGLAGAPRGTTEELQPAVPVSKSIMPDYLVCLEDGRKLKMLKRYLRSRFDMTPEDYRAKWNLPIDYPMVAANYAKLRSKHAKDIGLGKKKK